MICSLCSRPITATQTTQKLHHDYDDVFVHELCRHVTKNALIDAGLIPPLVPANQRYLLESDYAWC